MATQGATGWLIGAGFSVDLGMPLVWELTDELRSTLTREKFLEMNQRASTHGESYPPELVEAFLRVLSDPNLHYEQIIGWIQTQTFDSSSDLQQRYYGLQHFLLQWIGCLLSIRHYRNAGFQKGAVDFYAGLRTIAEREGPLWIFSLNHDLCVELISATHGIPLYCGVTRNRSLVVPRRHQHTKQPAGELRFDRLTHGDLVEGRLDVLRSEPGINLIKLHGSLDVFAYGDEMDYVRVNPVDDSIDGWLETVRILEEELFWEENGHRIRATNEIAYVDGAGEVQFLQRTLLSCAYKFERRISQNAPPELLQFFRNKLSSFRALVVIGYSFGDPHVNGPLRSWLSADPEHRLTIVDPRGRVPDCLADMATQIDVRREGATDFISTEGAKPLTELQRAQRLFTAWFRRQPNRSAAKTDFLEFIKAEIGTHTFKLIEQITGADRRCDESPEAYARRVIEQHPVSLASLYERFLQSRGDPA